ncbi:MAG: alpha-N-arabinofuranosidase [Lachnospiraceae bacterium]|nr:alpha-N-arabinofuranosidase [Lachnospiraceae bacterium]
MTKMYINPNVKLGKINKEIYGNFSEHLGRCIYEGLYVGENSDIPNKNGMRTDVVEALKEMKLPVLRWPGGCFADEYHWEDGIGPKETRKKLINTHWGGVLEDNSFGTHEFMELCEQIGCETYINGNVGSGTVREMSEWVEYMTFEGVSPQADRRKANGHEGAYTVNFFGVGNENWGCGGNMTPDFYANLYRQYQTYIRQYNPEKKIYKIACGANAADYHWTDKVMEIAHRFMDGISLHYYTVPGEWAHKGGALGFDEKKWYLTLKKTCFMDELLDNNIAIMDKYDPKGRIGLIVDEWGTWYDVEEGTNPGFLYQQNSIRDALVAGINLNIFNKHCKRVRMANIAQLVNVLQSVILTEGAKMVKTPTYFVFKMFADHQDAELVSSSIETKEIGIEDENKVKNLYESCSVKDGKLTITLANLSLDEDYDIDAVLTEAEAKNICGEIVTGAMDAHNTFDKPDTVKTEEFKGFEKTANGLKITIPAKSVVKVSVEI